MQFLDWRDQQANPPEQWRRAPARPPKALIERGRVVERDMSEITGITLHQTACLYAVSKAQIAAARGDRALARNRRAQAIPAHGVTFQDGTVIANAPLSWYLYHANGLNRSTLGIECEGKYSGPKNLKEVPAEQIEATRYLLKWLVITARREGAINLEFVYAHRQSNGIKPGDPGCELWHEVVVEYARPVLGLKVRYDFVEPPTPHTKTKMGRPIPKAWDPNGVGPY